MSSWNMHGEPQHSNSIIFRFPRAYAFLSGYQKARKRIDQLTCDVQLLRQSTTDISHQLNGVHESTASHHSRTEKLLTKIDLKEREIERERREMENLKTDILLLISDLSGTEMKEIIMLYYLEGMSMTDIASTIVRSRSTVRRMMLRAMSEAEQILNTDH